MTVDQLYIRMAERRENEMRDVNYFSRVWAYARNIGMAEGLDAETQFLTEAAAILHDIACPNLRREFGRADYKKQEEIGALLAREFLADTDLTAEQVDRLCFLVGHHHSPEADSGIDFQILIEADYLVNADSHGDGKETLQKMYDAHFHTETGRELLKKLYLDRKRRFPVNPSTY